MKQMDFLKKHKNDILLVLALLILGGAFWVYTSFGRDAGAEVLVSVAGEELYRLPIDEDTEVLIGEGDKTNLLVISSGEAFISEASCPDHICVKSGKVSLEGQTIVCLPNKVVVSIAGGDTSGIDGMA